MKTIAHTWRHSKKILNVSFARVTIITLKKIIRESKLRFDGLVFKAYFFFQAHLKRGSVEKVRPHRGLLYVSTGNISRRITERLLCQRNITVVVLL